MSFKTDYKVKS